MNTQTKHTPGPWMRGYSNHHHAHDIYAGKANGFQHVAFVNTAHADDANKSEADARLIAAAPELLEALRKIVSRWDDFFPGRGNTYKPSCAEFADIARAAIAKATQS